MPVSLDGYEYQDVARAVEIGIHDRHLEQGQHSLQGAVNRLNALQAWLSDTLPPNSTIIGYTSAGALLTYMHPSTNAVSALRNVWVLTRP